MSDNTIRIQKALSDNGVLSRRKAEEYIRQGRITVNGRPARLGHPVNPARDHLAIDGEPVQFARKKHNLYLILHKPRGYVTTTSDELGRKCITELIADLPQRVYPVGRLDKLSEGLLLLTNDGEFANFIMHPSHHVKKSYRVTVRPDITDEQAAQLGAGVDIGEGETSGPAQVLVLDKQPGRAVIQITIEEGKNRQVRRMCEAVGLEVARLRRTSVGPIKLGMLQPGKWRELTPAEVGALRNASKTIEQPVERGPRAAKAATPRGQRAARPGEKSGFASPKSRGGRPYGAGGGQAVRKGPRQSGKGGR